MVFTPKDCCALSALQHAKRIIIAYSGGMDSRVLLDVIAEQCSQPKIAVHVNHGLHPNADDWQAHCQTTCQHYGIAYQAHQLELTEQNNLEARARDARYAVLADIVQAGDVVVMAQHQDDQAETLLLQLFRGAGLKGLAAMPAIRPFSQGQLARPFLHLSRAQLSTYAKAKKLQWIDDPSNTDKRFDRNFLRHDILPKLTQRWPAINKNLARSAGHCGLAELLLTDLVQVQLKPISFAETSLEAALIDGGAIAIDSLQTYDKAHQQQLLRTWLVQLGFPLPSQRQLCVLVEQIIPAKADAKPLLAWSDVTVYRYQQGLYALRKLAKNADSYVWQDPTQALVLPNLTLAPSLLNNIDLSRTQGQLRIQFRQTGERFHPAGRAHSQTLKKLLQEWRVPNFLRDQVPLLVDDTGCIAVLFYAVVAHFHKV